MDVLRTAVSLVGVNDCERQDADPAAIHAKALRLLAVLPTVIAMDQRRRHGLGAIAPRNDIGYAANFLYMTFGKVPEPQIVAAFETSLILGAGHSANAAIPALTAGAVTPSTFDIYNAVVGAIDAFKGSPAADASDAVMAMMNEIAVPDNARPWLEAALVDGRKIMGFGHRVYKNGDPRVPVMRARLGMIAALRRGSDLLEIHDTLAATMYDAKGLRPNLGYPVGLAYHLIGFDASTFTPILAAVCLPGWTAAIVDLIAADSPFSP
jgi:citrate synthase